jgi:hypothetical protein
MIGLVSALATIAVVAGFSRQRLAGVIAPLLLVTSGTLASAATSGTEYSLTALLCAGSFLAQERRLPRTFGVLASLLCLARPEGLFFTLGLLLLERARRDKQDPARKAMFRAYLAPLAVVALLAFLRSRWTGSYLSPATESLVYLDGDTILLGLAHAWETALLLGSPLLIAVAIALLLVRRLRGHGARALFLGLLWSALVIVQGGDDLPFGEALLPALPLLFVAVQEALTRLMDSRRPAFGALAWALFLLGLTVSLAGSKFPADLGPFRIGEALRARLEPGARTGAAWDRRLGRLGLQEELERTARLRRLGIFVRDRMDPGASILSPWPGALAYLSRHDVFDMLERASPARASERQSSWAGLPRVDLVELLAQKPDYIVPTLVTGPSPPPLRDIAMEWILRFDAFHDVPGRPAALAQVLKPYELIAVPLPVTEEEHEVRSEPFLLLRRRGLGLGPSLALKVEGDDLRVLATHRGHQQIADLEVELLHEDGERSWLRPTGTFVRQQLTHARTGLLFYEGTGRAIELLRVPLPADPSGVQIRAQLRNPGPQNDAEFSQVSETVTLDL